LLGDFKMARIVREPKDAVVLAILGALANYEKEYPGSRASLYRRSEEVVCVRVIDSGFAGIPFPEREDQVRFFIANLPTDADLSCLWYLPLTPEEAASSIASKDFD
jgi:hypothetical protein